MSKNYDYVLGQNSYDCGISSIMTILLYYGIKASRENIVSKIKKQNNGYTAYDLIRIAKLYGIDGYGIKTNIRELPKTPAIAHTVKDKNMFHFIVILENNIKKKQLRIMDPSKGINIISYREFESITTGIFLVFDGRSKKKIKNMRFKKEIIKIFQNNKRIIFRALLLSIVYIVLSLVFNYYLKAMLANNRNKNVLFLILIVFLQLCILKSIINYIKEKLTFKISKKINKDITDQVTNHIFNLPYEYFVSKTTGELVTITQDIEIFKQVVTKVFISSFVDMIFIFVILVYLCLFNLYLALLCFLLIIILVSITKKYQYIFNDHYVRLKNSKIDYTTSLINYFTSFETLKNLNVTPIITNKLSNKYNDSLNYEESYNRKYYQYNFITTLITDAFYLIVIYISFLLIYTNSFNLYDIVFFSSIFYLTIGLVNQINEGISLYKVYETSTDRVLDCLEVKPEVFNETNFSKIRSIKFNGVGFKANDLCILKNINLTCNKNDKIFITGPSGIGKSTLMKLMLKYYAPTEGNILIDNINIKDMDLSFLRENITYIGQNESLFPDTILNNLTLVPQSKDKIEKISQITLLDEFLIKNGIDYNYLIEESGYNLSGGERKKIILTRGLLHLKEVLILDEVFNEISVDEERKILENIFNEYKDKIIIVISHRNNNEDLFNKKYVLEGDGRIHEIK